MLSNAYLAKASTAIIVLSACGCLVMSGTGASAASGAGGSEARTGNVLTRAWHALFQVQFFALSARIHRSPS